MHSSRERGRRQFHQLGGFVEVGLGQQRQSPGRRGVLRLGAGPWPPAGARRPPPRCPRPTRRSGSRTPRRCAADRPGVGFAQHGHGGAGAEHMTAETAQRWGSTLDSVVVYAQGALCRRLARGTVPPDGRVRVTGLPRSLDPGSLRARVLGAPGVRVTEARVEVEAEPLGTARPTLRREVERLRDEYAAAQGRRDRQLSLIEEVTGAAPGPAGPQARGPAPPHPGRRVAGARRLRRRAADGTAHPPRRAGGGTARRRARAHRRRGQARPRLHRRAVSARGDHGLRGPDPRRHR